ncbi:HAD family hydrolase [Paenibacillus sp. M1]|uniref:HAD family hydrolase n=1 Tax=Paenibacillus haidiansis TaxID=1574488 RepID=A0ABU7VWK9_9BACL
MTVFVFDLDDTLYEEITFVRSGFRAVAGYLSQEFKVSANEAFRKMWSALEQKGRGSVFNEVLRDYGLETQRNIRKSLSVYRQHIPQIKLLEDAEQVLQRLPEGSAYIVTDGNKLVQHSKVQALGLYPRIKKCFITYRYGRAHSKPSPYCFQKISQIEKRPPADIVYIGDNPNKDFIGIKPLGFRTIQIKRGPYSNLKLSERYCAEAEVDHLLEIFDVIHQWKV